MKKVFQEIIIWLFEKYAQDYWVDKQYQTERKEIKEKFNLKDEEIDEFLIDRQREPEKEAYYVGREDGYNKAIDECY